MKKIISIIIIALLMISCEDRFLRVNSGADAVPDDIVAADFSFMTRFVSPIRNLTVGQTGEDLATDTYVRQVGCPTNFEGNRNNTTYFIVDGWNDLMFNNQYNNVMSPLNALKKITSEQGYDLLTAWAELIQAFSLSRATVYYGPLIYSEYGEKQTEYVYDSEKFLYEQIFANLDAIQAVFRTYSTYSTTAGEPNFSIEAAQMGKGDLTYNGNIGKWLKMINSFRLRLAMRIVKADAAWAKREGEKAINDPAGLILANSDNFFRSSTGSIELWTMSESWNDTRMSAGHEEVLIGYKDPRLAKWWQPVAANFATLYPNYVFPDPNFKFKGIASGSYITAKDDRIPYSKATTYWRDVRERMLLDASEVNFILAEAALRGWNVSKTAGEYYEDGIRRSMERWGVTAAEITTYLADNTSKPLQNYIDPADSRNNYTSRMDITIKWEDGVGIGNEEKLERIMMQKWIACFNNANEIWSDHRRTGYPKLHFNPKNDSGETWGTIADNDFLKRMPYVQRERLNNPAYDRNSALLGSGGDKISTPLWIHTPWVDHNSPSNF